MIHALKGKVVKIDQSGIVLRVGDVFYALLVPHPEDFSLQQETEILTTLIVREDDLTLIGFSSEEEKRAFHDLIKVSGIGPKTALNALSMTRPDLFYQAVATKDIRYLKKLPGIGPKAASQIILDIKGHLVAPVSQEGQRAHVITALKDLGFRLKEIEKALLSVDQNDLSDEQVLKAALVYLGKNR
ncbi:MAG: Holliday junction branch migration protein RuvA [Bacilli bacterium]|jgi:Holliday junction DNA helicase RuvA